MRFFYNAPIVPDTFALARGAIDTRTIANGVAVASPTTAEDGTLAAAFLAWWTAHRNDVVKRAPRAFTHRNLAPSAFSRLAYDTATHQVDTVAVSFPNLPAGVRDIYVGLTTDAASRPADLPPPSPFIAVQTAPEPELYAVGFATGPNAPAITGLYQLTAAGDAIHRVSTFSRFDADPVEYEITGLVYHGDGNLYGVGNFNNAMFQVSPSGRAVQISENGMNVGSTRPTALASFSGELYFIDHVQNALFRFDLMQRRAVRVTAAGGTLTTAENSATGLATHNGVLYLVGQTSQALHRVDLATGTATVVAPATVAFGIPSLDPTGLTAHNGRLLLSSDDAIFELDPLTGVATPTGITVPAGVTLMGLASTTPADTESVSHTVGATPSPRVPPVPVPTNTGNHITSSTVIIRVAAGEIVPNAADLAGQVRKFRPISGEVHLELLAMPNQNIPPQVFFRQTDYSRTTQTREGFISITTPFLTQQIIELELCLVATNRNGQRFPRLQVQKIVIEVTAAAEPPPPALIRRYHDTADNASFYIAKRDADFTARDVIHIPAGTKISDLIFYRGVLGGEWEAVPGFKPSYAGIRSKTRGVFSNYTFPTPYEKQRLMMTFTVRNHPSAADMEMIEALRQAADFYYSPAGIWAMDFDEFPEWGGIGDVYLMSVSDLKGFGVYSNLFATGATGSFSISETADTSNIAVG